MQPFYSAHVSSALNQLKTIFDIFHPTLTNPVRLRIKRRASVLVINASTGQQYSTPQLQAVLFSGISSHPDDLNVKNGV